MDKLETTGLKPGKILIDKNSCLDLFMLLLSYLYSKEDICVLNVNTFDINQYIKNIINISMNESNEYHSVEYFSINGLMSEYTVRNHAIGMVKSIFIELNCYMSDTVLKLIKEYMITAAPHNKYFIILADDINNPRYKDIVKCSQVYSVETKESEKILLKMV